MIPVLVNTPEPMMKLRVVTVKDNSEQTLKVLQRVGVLHIAESEELEPVDRAALEDERREVNELLSFIEKVLGYLPRKEPVILGEDVEVVYTRPFSEISQEVRTLYNKTDKLHERIDKLDEESGQLTELARYLEPIAAQTDLRLKDLNFTGDYLLSRVIILSGEAYENYREELGKYITENVVVSVNEETIVHAVAEVKDREAIESLLAEIGGRTLEVPDEEGTLRGFLEAAEGKLEGLEDERAEMLGQLEVAVGEDLKRLVLLREALAAESERLQVLEKATEAR
jgi:vacuolar-type H+-ATPase subunit I/STV1